MLCLRGYNWPFVSSYRAGPGSERAEIFSRCSAWITTPDSVETRIGTLKFHNGAPDEETVKLVYDHLDFSRGVDAFLTGIPATSVRAACNGLEEAGIKKNQAFGITEDLMDARSLFLTPNTTTVYVFTCLDLTNGPMVLKVPTGVLGPVDDAYFRWVTDIGLTGPDAGKGGQYLFVPPGYTGDLPAEGYFVVKPRTNTLAGVLQGVREGTATSRRRSSMSRMAPTCIRSTRCPKAATRRRPSSSTPPA